MDVKRLTPQMLFDLGLLHDCKISSIRIDSDRMSLELEDLHANTRGLPEYPGAQSAVVSIDLRGVEESTLTALKGLGLPARIYELEMEEETQGATSEPRVMTLRLWPAGSFDLPAANAELLLK